MISYFLAFFWGIFILVSLIGWGGITNGILFPKHRVDWGQRAAWGVAFSVVIGGVLNVTWTISKMVILIYLGLGLVYWIFDSYKNRDLVINSLSHYIRDCLKNKAIFIGTLIVGLLIIIQYAGWVSTPFEFNQHDDYHGYFVFPNKMLQMGSMGDDPFSERRLVSALGGQSFLDTFILVRLSEKNLNIIDVGCGLIIACGLIGGYFKEKKVSNAYLLITIFIFSIIDLRKANTTSTMIAVCLFISLFRTIDWSKLKYNNFVANSFIIALITAAICTLKSNLIPACVILFTLSYFFHIFDSVRQPKAIYEFLTSTALVFIFLLPWMLSMYQSSGTLLYPLLGRGYHGSIYGTLLLPSSEIAFSKAILLVKQAITSNRFLAFYLLSFIVIIQQRKKLIIRESPISLIISVVLGTVLITLATGGFTYYRYSAPFVVASIFILVTLALNKVENRDIFSKSIPGITAISVALITVIIFNGSSATDKYIKSIENLKLGLKNVELISNLKAHKYIEMQHSVPEKATVLTRLDKPFLLDFNRNKIFIADYPGGASLPPGMPFFKGSESLADYLTSKSIRYVAYSYVNEAGFDKKRYEARLSPEMNTWLRTQAQHTFDFQDNLKELSETRKRIYDDGENFVLDLLSLKN